MAATDAPAAGHVTRTVCRAAAISLFCYIIGIVAGRSVEQIMRRFIRLTASGWQQAVAAVALRRIPLLWLKKYRWHPGSFPADAGLRPLRWPQLRR